MIKDEIEQAKSILLGKLNQEEVNLFLHLGPKYGLDFRAVLGATDKPKKQEANNMPKKNLWLMIFVLFSFSALGGALYYNHYAQKQRNENTVQNHTGDLSFQSKDFEEVTPPPNPPEAAKSEVHSAAAPAPANSATRAGSDGVKPNSEQQPASGGGGPPQQPASGESDPLRGQIEQKYISRLQSLASGYEGELNRLISAALSEYNAAKKNNPNTDISPLINKYYSAGKALEAECDSQFYSVLAAFESELKKNSFPMDEAVRAKETYEARKSARAGQITPGKP